MKIELTDAQKNEVTVFRARNPKWLENDRKEAIQYLAWFIGATYDAVEEELKRLEKPTEKPKAKNKK